MAFGSVCAVTDCARRETCATGVTTFATGVGAELARPLPRPAAIASAATRDTCVFMETPFQRTSQACSALCGDISTSIANVLLADSATDRMVSVCFPMVLTRSAVCVEPGGHDSQTAPASGVRLLEQRRILSHRLLTRSQRALRRRCED